MTVRVQPETIVIPPEQGACERASGEWDSGKQICGMTAQMCTDSTDGQWMDGICVANVPDEDTCTGFSGMAWREGRCIVSHITPDELFRAGF